MPLEQRLRDGFHRSAGTITPDVEAGLRDIGTRRRRRRIVRTTVRVIAAAAIVTAVISIAPSIGSFLDGNRVPAGPSPTVSTPPPGTPIDGRWVTPSLSRQEYLAAIPSKYRDRVSRNQDVTESISFGLVLEDGRWAAIERRPDRPPVEGQTGTFLVHGERVTMTDPTGTTYLYRWTVSGDTLTLVLLRDTAGPTGGVPDRVYQHLIYELQAFTRVS
jgi:hypothetical protein